MIRGFVEQFTYVGAFVALLLAGIGVPIPEEVPIVASAVLSHEHVARWWIALPTCLLGVLFGDVILYWGGRHWGKQILDWRLVHLVLNSERAERLTAAYQRHAMKTVFTARHVMPLRAAAFLTAGIVCVPFWKFIVADAIAAGISVPIAFTLAYFFTHQVKVVMADVRRIEHWVGLLAIVVVAIVLAILAWRGRSLTNSGSEWRPQDRAG